MANTCELSFSIGHTQEEEYVLHSLQFTDIVLTIFATSNLWWPKITIHLVSYIYFRHPYVYNLFEMWDYIVWPFMTLGNLYDYLLADHLYVKHGRCPSQFSWTSCLNYLTTDSCRSQTFDLHKKWIAQLFIYCTCSLKIRDAQLSMFRWGFFFLLHFKSITLFNAKWSLTVTSNTSFTRVQPSTKYDQWTHFLLCDCVFKELSNFDLCWPRMTFDHHTKLWHRATDLRESTS